MKQLFFVLCCICTQVTAQVTVTVDPTKGHQTIHGFGAFGGIKPYWETPPFHTEPFLDYFLSDLGSTIVRTNIFWDLEPENDNSSSSQLDLSKFNYKSGSNLGRQLPYYRALRDAGLKRLIATSWTPPDWMKLHDEQDRIPDECYNCNNCPMGDERRKVCGGRLDPKYYAEYAEYLMAYVRILKEETGIDLYAISIQNEPWFANPFESNVVRADEYGVLLNVVGKKFRDAGLTTKIFGPEHMAEWSWGVQKDYISNIFQNGEDNSYLDIYAVHGYVDGVAPDFGSAEGWTALKANISDAYGKPLWMTETSGYPQTLEGAMKLAQSMYLALRFGEISAWVYWSISGEPGSEFALMSNGEPTILYYASKQFFKFIRPGARRIECSSPDPDVLSLAFQNTSEGSMTLVMINNSEQSKDIVLDITSKPETFTVYRTSGVENALEAGTVTNTATLPAKSITTLVGYGSAGPAIDEVPNYYFNLGEDGVVEIPLTGVDAGAGTALKMEVTSSNEDIVPKPEVTYSYPSNEGTLVLKANTSTAGKSVITLRLDNESTATDFGFDTYQISFEVEVFDVVTGIKKKAETELMVYPNPARQDVLSVDVSGLRDRRSFVVRDTQGKTMLTLAREALADNVIHFNTQGWTPGVYFVEVRSGKRRIVQKVLVH